MFPISENRIQKIITKGKRLIDSHNVVFFDVFDTLITRDCSKTNRFASYKTNKLGIK